MPAPTMPARTAAPTAGASAAPSWDRKELAEIEKKIATMIAVIEDGDYVRGHDGSVARAGGPLGRA